MEQLHGEKYVRALEMARKYVSQYESTPILRYVFHRPDGSIVATDRHRLMIARGVHGFTQENGFTASGLLIDPKTFQVHINGAYPEVDKIFPKESQSTIKLNADDMRFWLRMHRAFDKLADTKRGHVVVYMSFTKKGFSVEVAAGHSKTNMTLPGEYLGKPNFEKVGYNAGYMADALETHYKMGSEYVTIDFTGPVSPILLDNGEGGVTALMLPYRLGR